MRTRGVSSASIDYVHQLVTIPPTIPPLAFEYGQTGTRVCSGRVPLSTCHYEGSHCVASDKKFARGDVIIAGIQWLRRFIERRRINDAQPTRSWIDYRALYRRLLPEEFKALARAELDSAFTTTYFK